MKANVYTIGQMAELCNISAKQLRYYDKKQVIVPAIRDENNNYRLYSHEQISDVLMVRDLRQLDMPLETIAKLLRSHDVADLQQELSCCLQESRAQIDEALARHDKCLELVFRVAQAKDYRNDVFLSQSLKTPTMEMVDVEERWLISTRRQGLYSIHVSFIDRRAELYGIAEKVGVTPIGSNMAIFHQGYMNQFCLRHEDAFGDVETAFELAGAHSGKPFCRKQKGFRAVAGIHLGPYREMIHTYEKIIAWAEEKGYALSGDSLEEYIVGESHTKNEDQYVTRLLLPLKGYQI